MYPHIKIKLIRQNAAQIQESALHNEGDIYFSLLEELNENYNLITKKIQSDNLCLVTRKDHPAVATMPLDYRKIASEPFLMFKADQAKCMNHKISEVCQQLGFRPRITETFDLYENLLMAIEAGSGIAILPYRSRQYMNTNLVFTLLDAKNDTLDTCIAWHGDSKNNAVPLFIDMFREYMQNHPEIF